MCVRERGRGRERAVWREMVGRKLGNMTEEEGRIGQGGGSDKSVESLYTYRIRWILYT